MREHPEIGTKVDMLYRKASGGDKTAYDFLCSFDQYFTDVMKFIRSESKDRDAFVQLLARTNTLYSLPFYVRNGHFLMLSVQNAFHATRCFPAAHCLALVIIAVADLKLGFDESHKLLTEIQEVVEASREPTAMVPAEPSPLEQSAEIQVSPS